MTSAQHREHDVLCQRCLTRRTWNTDDICDECAWSPEPEQVPCCPSCYLATGGNEPMTWDGETEEFYCPLHDGVRHCKHEHTDYQPADRSVGMSEFCVCEDCGADLTEEMQEAREEAKAEWALARWEAER